MKFLISKTTDPYMNLSVEEVLVRDQEIKDEIVYIYINDNTIVMGRNQNTLEEVDLDYVKKHKINLVRRISGGGAVYHDLGNINFSFVTNKNENSYAGFLEPIIKFLRSIGLNANFKGKNDIEVDGYKISGNAQYIHKDRMFHHGTLLFNTDLTVLGDALTPHPLKLQSKGIKSAKTRVSNIKNLLKTDMNSKEFTESLQDYFINSGAEVIDIKNYKKDEIKNLYEMRKSKE